jgi:hypothetical protein
MLGFKSEGLNSGNGKVKMKVLNGESMRNRTRDMLKG